MRVIGIVQNKKTQPQAKQTVIRYAWANQERKTWFITQTHFPVVIAGSRILFVLRGEITTDNLSTADTYPKIGDVVSDIHGAKIKITSINSINQNTIT